MNTLKKSGSAWLTAMLMTLALATAAQAQTTANWIGPASGGEWNTGVNWDTGFAPLDPTTNAFVGPGTNVNYNVPMATASFGSLGLRGVLNINASGFNNTGILLNNPGGGSKVFLNAGGVANVTGNFGISSNGMVLVAPGSSLTVSGGLNIGSDTAGGSAGTGTLGSFGNVTNNGGFISAGSTTFNPKNQSLVTGNHALMVINGGTNNLGNVDIHRSGGTSQAALGVEGLVINGGFVNMTSLRLGDNNFGTMLVAPGAVVTNTGAGTFRNTTAARPSRLLQTGGYFITAGINTLTVPAATGAGVTFSVTGGTNFSSGFQFGDPAALANLGTVNFTNAASIFVDAAGMISNGAAGVNISLNAGGRFAATTDWTNGVSIILNGGSIDAEDPSGAPHNIYSSGILRGAGSLIKTGGGTLTLTASNTFSGSTLINSGVLALAPDVSGSTGSLASASILVGSGTTFDVSQAPTYMVNAFQTLGGSGVVNGSVTVGVNGVVNPGSNSVSAALAFNNDLIEPAGAVNHFDVPGDVVNVGGSFTVGGTNTVEIAGSLPTGTVYALIHYGAFSGGVTNFIVLGASGVLSNSVADKTLYFIIGTSLRGNTNVTWVGNSLVNDWDTHNLTNWVDGGTAPLDFFLSGDKARFDNIGAVNPIVNIPGSVGPGTVVVDSTSNYVFSGVGLIGGPATSLTKTNSGTLKILTTNSYAGITTLGGGALEVLSIANGAVPSPLGSASFDPTFLVFNGGTLRYSGDTASSDRGMTLNTSGTIDVTNSATTLTIGGNLVGSGSLTKIGNGTLSLGGVSTYAGNTTISGGTVIANGVSTIGTAEIDLNGGTLSLAASASVQQFYASIINVLSTSTLIVNGGNANNIIGNSSGAGGLTNSGFLNLSIPNSGGTCTINAGFNTNFTGTIRLTDDTVGSLRFNSGGSATAAQQCNGSPTTTFDLGNGSGSLFNRNGGGASFGSYNLGALLGGVSTFLRGSANSGTLSTYVIGAKNLDTIYAGTIANGSTGPTAIMKVGSDTLTLQGQNSFTGSTIVSNGILALAFNPTNVADGSIASSASINILAGAILDVSGRSDDTLPLTSGQVLSGYGTLRGILDTTQGGTLAPGDGVIGNTGTLTVTNTATLGGTTWMKLNHAGSPNSDRLIAPSINVTSGTLIVTNAGGALRAGETFVLFSGPITGTFANIVLPNYYTFDATQLYVNGTIKVATVSLPSIAADFSSFLSGNSITFNGANGIPGNSFTILGSTNVALPLASWTLVVTGNFDGSGNYSVPVTVDPTVPTQFFILSAQ